MRYTFAIIVFLLLIAITPQMSDAKNISPINDDIKINQASNEYIYDFEDGVVPNDEIIEFSPGYKLWGGNELYPPYSGNTVAYSNEANNFIRFSERITYFSAYYTILRGYYVYATNVDGDILTNVDGDPAVYHFSGSNVQNELVKFETIQPIYEIKINPNGHSGYANWVVDYITIKEGGVFGPSELDYKYKSINASLSLNVTIENGTIYDAYLNDELIETQNYENGTISVNISSIFTNFSYSNFSISNYTKYEFANLTFAFHTELNITFTHFVNVTVYDYTPQIFHDIFDVDHEVGESQILNFNVSDDNLDSLKVYQNNTHLYSTDLNSSMPTLDLNDFIDGSYKLTQYNFTLSFIDSYVNNVNQSLLVNLLDTTKPVLSLFTADDYMETETDGLIRFKAIDPTLSNYTLMINNVTLSIGSVSSNELIEISNANYSEGEYNVTLLLLDRANNSLSFTTSFTVDAYVAPTNTTNTTETTETTETSTETSTEVSTEVSTQTISNAIIPEEPSSDFGSNLLIIIAGIVVGLTGIELFRRQIDKNSK
ncbi:MAG: hypothetical protein CME83_02525 [Candidatus Heimdallarchaeota archaeon]|nr:hypothetical protein [Candidatus Heimdallarchaeota archaeon]